MQGNCRLRGIRFPGGSSAAPTGVLIPNLEAAGLNVFQAFPSPMLREHQLMLAVKSNRHCQMSNLPGEYESYLIGCHEIEVAGIGRIELHDGMDRLPIGH